MNETTTANGVTTLYTQKPDGTVVVTPGAALGAATPDVLTFNRRWLITANPTVGANVITGRRADHRARHFDQPSVESAGHLSDQPGASMKSTNIKSIRLAVVRSAARGFTLIELTIAITVFLVIGAAAMSLFKQHASLFSDQQYQIGLNVSLRNALSQMENDVVNAGTGWYNAANNVASWPIGVKIVNNTAGGATCHPPGHLPTTPLASIRST